MSRSHAVLSRIFIALAAAALAACGGASGVAPTAQAPSTLGAAHLGSSRTAPQYRVVTLGTLGGTIAAGISIRDHNAVSGFSTLPGNNVVHAALWKFESTAATDLGTLGGVNSAVEWPNHDMQEVVGISQTSMTDPLGEQWSCSAFIPYTGTTCLGFVWHSDGSGMTPLSTFGGNNGYAAGADARGDVVGWAENAKHDSTCVSPQVLQFEAAEWTPDGTIHELPPLAGDRDGAATAINDRGDVVGISGICQNSVGGLSAKHALIWRDGTPTYLGGLGGAGWNTPTGINNEDEVVGFADRSGDQHATKTNFHAFLWTEEDGMQDLGTLPGDAKSQAYAVNDSGLIVGLSCIDEACGNTRAFVWQDGTMTDLNSLVPKGSPYLVYANDVDDRGVITGLASDPKTGDLLAFRAIPDERGTASLGQPVQAGAHAPIHNAHLHLRLGAFGKLVP